MLKFTCWINESCHLNKSPVLSGIKTHNNLFQNSTKLKAVSLVAQRAKLYARPEKLVRFSSACPNFPRVQ